MALRAGPSAAARAASETTEDARDQRLGLLHDKVNGRFADDRRLGPSGYTYARG